jgi:polygalacturonase
MAALKNFSYSIIAIPPSPANTGTTLTVSEGHGILFAKDRPAVIYPTAMPPLYFNAEIVQVTNVVGDVLTITRAQEGTAAVSILGGHQIAQPITAEEFNQIEALIASKVDSVPGKGLSTNDFTDDLESKLNGIEPGAQVNVNADWESTEGDSEILNKPTLGNSSSKDVGTTEDTVAAGDDLRLNTVFNVKSYGAVGDGVTEDTTAIAETISACVAAGGGRIFFPKGTYLSETITVSSSLGVTISGTDKTSAILKSKTVTAPVLSISGNNVCVETLGFDGAYTTGSTSGNFGIVDITAGSGTSAFNCSFSNGKNKGLAIHGAASDVKVSECYFINHFCSLQSLPVSTLVPQRITVTNCTFDENWGSGNESGAIKLSGTGNYLVAQYTSGHRVCNNTIINTGQMGVEIWGGCSHCIVSGNTIEGVDWGISFDGMVDGQANDNNVKLITYLGIESASGSDITFNGNNLNGYNAAGAITASRGIVTSNTTPKRINISGGSIIGFDHGIHIQTSTDVSIGGGIIIYGCIQLINLTASSRVKIGGVCLAASANTSGHLMLDCTDLNMSDIDISNCTLTGNSSGNNLTIYDGNGSRTITNLVIAYNNVTAATNTSGNSIWTNLSNARLIHYTVHGNDYVTTSGACQWADGGTYVPAYAQGIQSFSIPVAARIIWAAASSVGDQWFKVLSLDQGRPIVLGMHVSAPFQGTDGRAQDITAYIIASPYGQNCQILKLPDAYYQGNVIKEIIYDNPSSGSVHEIWVRIAPTSGGTITVVGADWGDNWIVAPTAVTSEPTWGSNVFKLNCVTDTTALKVKALSTQHLISSGTAPTAVVGSAAGTTPSAVTITGHDAAFKLALTTGTSCPASGVIATLTFNVAFEVAPHIVVSPGGANAALAAAKVYSTATQTTFVLSAAAALTDATAYTWECVCVQ